MEGNKFVGFYIINCYVYVYVDQNGKIIYVGVEAQLLPTLTGEKYIVRMNVIVLEEKRGCNRSRTFQVIDVHIGMQYDFNIICSIKVIDWPCPKACPAWLVDALQPR